MLIDPFVVIAQLVNFAILVWLLKRFLYGPITRVMAAREERIRAETEEAHRLHVAATAEGEQYRALLAHVCATLGFDGSLLRGHRVLSEYPIYGTQFAMTLRTTEPPADARTPQ